MDDTGEVTIRPFAPERDSQRVRELVGEIWGGGADALIEKQYGVVGGRPWSEWMAEAVLSYLGAEGTRSFVAEGQGEVVGFCSYVVEPARQRGTVGYNGVARSHQGRGIGSLMLDFVLAGMRAEGMEHALVLVADNEEHLPARRNYRKHGFRRFAGYHHLIQKL